MTVPFIFIVNPLTEGGRGATVNFVRVKVIFTKLLGLLEPKRLVPIPIKIEGRAVRGRDQRKRPRR
jgi:hypothetical protein